MNCFYSTEISGNTISVTFAEAIPDGQHVVMMRKTGTAWNANEIDMWVDGVQLTPQTVTTNGVAGNTETNQIVIGADQATSPTRFLGRIRGAEIVNRPLSDTEMVQASQVASMEIVEPYTGGNYILAPDFNQTSGNIQTIAGTPLVIYTAIGGAAYSKYNP